MKTSKLNYELPKELIAARPAEPRDAARLMVLQRNSREVEDSTFGDIGKYLRCGDVLVLNQTKVFPARIHGVKETGGKVEVVFLSEGSRRLWEVIIGGKVIDGQVITFSNDFSGKVKIKNRGMFLEVEKNRVEVFEILESLGEMPLPPYMKREAEESDKSDYQTVFAKTTGSAAAPTAGLHFTKGLLKKLQKIGVQIEYVTLHVGLGTFAPVKTEILEDHPIHSEYFEIDEKTAIGLNQAKRDGRRIVAVGTTVVRTLESAIQNGIIIAQKTETKLFIYPGYRFQFVDGLVTNFHTPGSSLLALVYAFTGEKNIRSAYDHAIAERYRFFSYGDGMLII